MGQFQEGPIRRDLPDQNAIVVRSAHQQELSIRRESHRSDWPGRVMGRYQFIILVPEANGPIEASRHEMVGVRADEHRADLVAMPPQHSFDRWIGLVRQVPDDDPGILHGCNQVLSDRSEGQIQYCSTGFDRGSFRLP